jgi:hypothetical protein
MSQVLNFQHGGSWDTDVLSGSAVVFRDQSVLLYYHFLTFCQLFLTIKYTEHKICY